MQYKYGKIEMVGKGLDFFPDRYSISRGDEIAQSNLPFSAFISKVCHYCRRSLLLSNFRSCSQNKDGLHSSCISCLKQYFAEYYKAHKDTFLQKSKHQRESDPARIKAYKKQYYLLNKITINAVNQRRKDANRAAVRESARRYYQANRERCLIASKNRKALKRGAVGQYSLKDVQNIFANQRGRCFWCHVVLTNYHHDHYIPIAKGGTNDASNIVLSCPSCNLRKHDKLPDDFREWLKTYL